MIWDDKFEKIRQEAMKVSLAILVWGPGQNSGDGYQQREKMRSSLQRYFPHAAVHFSEDEEMWKGKWFEKLHYTDQELIHLAACDVCVVLATSDGPKAEIAHYLPTPYVRKFLVLIHEKEKDSHGFLQGLRSKENVLEVHFKDEDYTSGDLIQLALPHLCNIALRVRLRDLS